MFLPTLPPNLLNPIYALPKPSAMPGMSNIKGHEERGWQPYKTAHSQLKLVLVRKTIARRQNKSATVSALDEAYQQRIMRQAENHHNNVVRLA
jgi:hypothetical protein